jgi:ATP-binding protein involved in chromosome partitioning
MKADKIEATGAEIVVAPCHNCRDKIMKALPKVHELGNWSHMGPEGGIHPPSGRGNLKVVSLEGLLADRDAPVIWRGPMKHKAIRRFLGEVEWGRLDFLIIDSPPRTGDEPMSVAQVVSDARAIIVTTPQEVALADVRKAINFCRNANLAVLGFWKP